MAVELLEYKIGWMSSRQEWRAHAVFATPYGERPQSMYFPAGSKPTEAQAVALMQAECEQWAADVAAASLLADAEGLTDG